MLEDFEATVEWVANKLMYSVPATEVEGEMLNLTVEGERGPELWSRNMTTYTLGLMLSGALIQEREGR